MASYPMCLVFTRKFRATEPGLVDDVREVFEKYTEVDAHMSPEQQRKLIFDEEGRRETSLEETEKIVDEIIRRRHHITN
ncbi:hypothetical protein Bca4012_026537 [Brassica carinata]|uniref:Uncharacterized protein n=1 Tax=Brassica carinata TaxID=52824 RepID=A0A8X7VIP6_BRACI|nr:hypothetical protein Bca52824_023568 [Brassica carinata]